MSGIKREIEKKEEYRCVARELLAEIGAIKNCEMHDFYYDKYKYSDDILYPVVTNRLKGRYPQMKDFKLFHECVKEIMDSADANAVNCPYCQKDSEE